MLDPRDFNPLTRRIIGAAIEVHKTLGCGFLEQVYQKAMFLELRESKINFDAHPQVIVKYKDQDIGYYIPDFLISGLVVLEIKAQERIDLEQIKSQIINYLVATAVPVGIYLNFGKPSLEFKRYLIPRKFQTKQ
ncbi:GxxExxY protein [Patescibacteria group bacterium]|nr:GxxExxY protein [Patescibacteria group bacterium]MBU1921713.1 GxxExxY protein [Patescibacteria group bacterium]